MVLGASAEMMIAKNWMMLIVIAKPFLCKPASLCPSRLPPAIITLAFS